MRCAKAVQLNLRSLLLPTRRSTFAYLHAPGIVAFVAAFLSALCLCASSLVGNCAPACLFWHLMIPLGLAGCNFTGGNWIVVVMVAGFLSAGLDVFSSPGADGWIGWLWAWL